MMKAIWRWSFLAMLVCGLGVDSAWAQQTGVLSGVVQDSQGGVLPGVTVAVTGSALIGGPRDTVSGATGAYQLTGLPPGEYVVTYELSGFATLRREGVIIRVAQTTRLDVGLSVGSLEQSITVSGLSPVVDVSTTVTQTNISKELYDAIPTGRNPWVMATLVPGVVSAKIDVGGTEGMGQYNIEAFGSASSQKTFSIDGINVNWTGGGGGSTMFYYGFEMYDEYNIQTGSGTAESDVAGVYMNMVTKSGGNRVASDHNVYFMNNRLASDNVDDTLRARLGLRPGQQSAAAGNPVDISYDWSSTLGGPIKRDRLWFFTASRWWRMDKRVAGVLNPDGSQAIDDNRIRNMMGKATYQVDPQTRTSLLYNRNLKDRFHIRQSGFQFSVPKATEVQLQTASSFGANLNRTFGKKTVLEVGVGRMWGSWPRHYQAEVQPTDIAIQDLARQQQLNAIAEQFDAPVSRFQANASVGYFADNFLGGSHNLKLGMQLSRSRNGYHYNRNGDIIMRLNDGVPLDVLLGNTPVNTDAKVGTWGVYLQDRWIVKRATFNVGVRVDAADSTLPAQSSLAGTFVGARSYAETGVFNFRAIAAPRLGISYDLFGNGQTALKAYFGRFYNQFGTEVAEAENPNGLINVQVPWTDRNGNLQVDPGELDLSRFTGFNAIVPRISSLSRPYSDEFNVGISHELLPTLAVSATYHRRLLRNGMGIVDLARPSSAYTPIQRTYTDPQRGPQTITVYNLNPALATIRDRIITNVDMLQSNYNGLELNMTKRMSNRWQLLGGVTFQKHQGFDHLGTFTPPGGGATAAGSVSNTDNNDPNYLLNRQDGAVFIDLPWTVAVSGSYRLPYDLTISGKYTGTAGYPLARILSVAGLNQGTETIYVQQRGVDRTESVTKFVDLRLARNFRLGAARLEGTLDMFNVLNANHVLDQGTVIGTRLGIPAAILTPRIFRFGATVRF